MLDGARQVILLVEDEKDTRESLKALFETCLDGVKVVTAASARPALEVVGREHVDVIISDHHMPDMDGVTFLRHARKRSPSTSRILVTGFPELGVALHAMNDAEIENFFTKPFEPEMVLSVVKDALRERRVRG